ncbi:hypothetical protein M878_02250 [Streptomyces roseochromogenus subsp. oscitans DS 12.976]|uniref:Uncharacterized protein n=1 Tax=Streptomyces roseochromogenus subsp. oscitans DS 12.976 TaxID=1352936 RepID=V6KW76_STRRC|nr:hypothetical protein M878_02250 [Streptomyces roseochromogenus subsp. oscitans DS 12.976]
MGTVLTATDTRWSPAHFYAANGWGATAQLGALFSYWLLASGITTYRSARRVPKPTTQSQDGVVRELRMQRSMP